MGYACKVEFERNFATLVRGGVRVKKPYKVIVWEAENSKVENQELNLWIRARFENCPLRNYENTKKRELKLS